MRVYNAWYGIDGTINSERFEVGWNDGTVDVALLEQNSVVCSVILVKEVGLDIRGQDCFELYFWRLSTFRRWDR